MNEVVVDEGFEVGGDLGSGGEGAGEGSLDVGGDAVGVADGHGIGKEEVDVNGDGMAEVSMAEVVVVDVVFVSFAVHDVGEGFLDGGVGDVHEAGDAFADEPEAGDGDVDGDKDGAEGVPVEPAGEGGEKESEEDAGAGPTVGEDVFAIGGKDDGIAALANADEVQAKGAIDDHDEEGNEDADAEALEFGSEEDGLEGFVEDVEGGDDDEGAFEAGGEEADFFVAVEVGGVGGLSGETEAVGGETDGEDVDDGFGGVAEDAGGLGEEVGGDFDNEEDEADGEGEVHGASGEALEFGGHGQRVRMEARRRQRYLFMDRRGGTSQRVRRMRAPKAV